MLYTKKISKIVEESPSPAVDEDLRKKMGEAAIAGAKAVGYVGVGTVEFLLDKNKDFDISVNVNGGGLSGQAGAIRLGIARALILADPDNRPLLKSNGLLTRDSRKVERKKPGQPGARKKFQFSKR